ncbi:WecB/TagA/CpsF family glycosyltransferase [Ornithinicoccus hortensis]
MDRRKRLFGLDIQSLTLSEASDLLSEVAASPGPKARVVVTPNVDHLVRLNTSAFNSEYAQAEFIFADGMPVVWASHLLGTPLPERVTGADLFVIMCERAAQNGWRVVLIGGQPGSEADLQSRFAHRFPGLRLEIYCPSMDFGPLGTEGSTAAELVRRVKPNLVFVCLGMPKQEVWALHYKAELPTGLILCVGAAMEFALGITKRAPRWIQRSGFEWAWRLGGDPRRLWRRYLVQDSKFLLILLREYRLSHASTSGDASDFVLSYPRQPSTGQRSDHGGTQPRADTASMDNTSSPRSPGDRT